VTLSAKRQAFVAEYLQCWNATEAARRAGYKHPNVQGPTLVNLSPVAEQIKTHLTEKAMTADEVLARLAEQARAEYAGYIQPDGAVDLQKMIDEGKAHLIKGIKWDRQGHLIVEFYDAQSALVHIGKSLGLFKDSADVNVELNFDLDSWKRQREERRRELEDVEDPGDLRLVEDDECASPDG